MSWRIIACSVAVVGAACAGGQPQPAASSAPILPDSIYVQVVNENYLDARIHAVYASGQRHSLGTIHGNGGETASVLPWQPRQLTFRILFIPGGQAYVSAPVDVVRGEVVEVRLPANIHGSGFFRRVSGK